MLSGRGSPRRTFDERFGIALMLMDVAVCVASVLIAYLLRLLVPTSLLMPIRHDIWMYVQAAPVAAGLWLITSYSLGLYNARRFVSPFAEMTAVFRAVSLTVLLVAAASFLSHTDYSRATLLLFWATGLVLALSSRAVMREYAESERSRGEARARALVVGCGDLARLVARRIRDYEVLGYELVGFVSVIEHPEDVEGYPIVGNIEHLADVVQEHDIDEVLVARPDVDPDTLMSAVQSCEGLPVDFHLVAGPLQVLTERAEISGLADLPVLEFPQPHFATWQLAAKRILDVIASVVLMVLFAPAMGVIAWLVQRETEGSPVFHQTRVGYRGRPFTMYKFRTMAATTEPYAEAPSGPDDQRVGKIGRLLRRSSLDELPQLLNVLKGDMSLVGPRPEMPFIVERYQPWQRRRLDMKPGLTGLWQILGRKDLPLIENIEYDFYYILNWSIWLDFTILLKTIPVVIGGRGAY